MSLDALKAEIATKRKGSDGPSGRPTKYMRRGELEKLKEEEERRRKEEEEAARRKDDEAKSKAKIGAKVSTLHFGMSFHVYLYDLLENSYPAQSRTLQCLTQLGKTLVLPCQNQIVSISQMMRLYVG